MGPFGQVLSEGICLVLIMHNKKEIGDRTHQHPDEGH